MNPWWQRVLYFAIIPAIFAAAGILGYTTWLAASRFTRLGEQTIAENTLLLVREKVETVERYIIDQDNAAFRMVDVRHPELIEEDWRPVASNLTPSIRALAALDDTGEMLALSIRGNAESRRDFLKVFTERILPEMELAELPVGRLKHLHRSFAGDNYLLSYKAVSSEGRRFYLVAHHDTGHIVRDMLPRLFATEEGKSQYNIVGEDNRRVYGPSLNNAGDYLVGHRFPTTLYGWRLQVAPKQAPRLEAQQRSRRATELSLLAVALVVLVLGVGFLLYAAAKERRLNALKGDFIANVSHELKTPLSVVRMFSEMLSTHRVKSEDKRQQYLEIISRESERLSTLIDNVLDFSALERGKQKYELRPGDLREVVTGAIETFRYRVEREGVEVALTISPDLPPVMMDEQAIVLALINLLDNAVKYGERSPVSVTVEPVRDFVQVRVRDRGPGIPEDAEKRIFDRFYRGKRDRQVRGSGIGLALVRHIAIAHGGRAWAANAEDGGAIVAFAIPVAQAEVVAQPSVAALR